MRRPTSDPYAWHKRALAGVFEGHPDEPHAGFFKTRLVRGGPFVPARIWLVSFTDDSGELVEDEVFFCEVDGRERDPAEAWSSLCGRPITKAEYDYMTSLSAWARQHAPDEPEADPRKPVDWSKMKPPNIKRLK